MASNDHVKTPSGDLIKTASISVMLSIPNISTLKNKEGLTINFAKGKKGEDPLTDEIEKFQAEVIKVSDKDKNHFVRTPNNNYIRREAIYSTEQFSGDQSKGVIIRGYKDRILDFIYVADPALQLRVVDELAKAMEVSSPTKRYVPDYTFLNQKSI